MLVYLGQKIKPQLYYRCTYTEAQLASGQPEQAVLSEIEGPAQQTASTSSRFQQPIVIAAVGTISKESFNATSDQPLLSDVGKHTIVLDHILNLDAVEKYFNKKKKIYKPSWANGNTFDGIDEEPLLHLTEERPNDRNVRSSTFTPNV